MMGSSNGALSNVAPALVKDFQEAEQWKEIDFTEKKYLVSNYGRVLSFALDAHKGRLLKGKSFDNRFCVDLKVAGKRKSFYVHRLVAELFVPRPGLEYSFVKHLNGITTDNHSSNLQWVKEGDAKSAFIKAARSGKRRLKKPTDQPADGHEYFKYAGFWFRVHNNGSGKFIRLTVALNKTKSVNLAEIILERNGIPRPSARHVLYYHDGNCYNLDPRNIEWVTRSQKSIRLLQKNENQYRRVQQMGKKNKKHFHLPDKMKVIIAQYRQKGRSYTLIAKLLGFNYQHVYRYCKMAGI